MTNITDEFYAILVPTRRHGTPVNGQRPVQEFKVDRIRRSKPYTDANEVAVKLRLTVASEIFDEIIPTVEVELTSADLFVNTNEDATLEAEPED